MKIKRLFFDDWGMRPVVFLGLLFLGIAFAIGYRYVNLDAAWIRDCAKRRPLVECKADRAVIDRDYR